MKLVKKEEKKLKTAVRQGRQLLSLGSMAKSAKGMYDKAMPYLTHPVAKIAMKSAFGFDPFGEANAGPLPSKIPVTRTTKYELSVAPRHKQYGNGIRVTASQVFDTVGATMGSTSPLTDGTVKVLSLSPDAIGGQIALDARNYNRFVFRECIWEYIPNVGSSGPTTATNAQQLAMAYTADGGINSFITVTYNVIESTKDSITTPTWQHTFFPVKPLSDILYYTEIDTANSATSRQTIQGTFMASYPVNAVATQSGIGYLVLHYIMDLYDRSGDYGFTIAITDKSKEIEVLKFFFKHYESVMSRRDKNRLKRLISPPVLESDSTLDKELTHLIDDEKSDEKFNVVEPPSPTPSIKARLSKLTVSTK